MALSKDMPFWSLVDILLLFWACSLTTPILDVNTHNQAKCVQNINLLKFLKGKSSLHEI